MRLALIQNLTQPLANPIRVRFCSSYWERLWGLMFRPHLAPDEGILLAEPHEGRLETAIHMLFMRFDIAVIWINRARRVVDLCHAHPWALLYVPRQPASYVLETHPDYLTCFRVNDEVEITLL
ncbi:DUF192 domain-containing protein [Thermanaerothrix sp. 4228-RoL]|uniref:DUF192 domain-containing protein n=1 Tax=Thermanaerothrix solaris TaxID=3058434 RepID=A0ABU3NJT3_9CHLR|nr:DUF192 domain-containing protein [Thermanaerothrix sp. 4228-RoL]MDT8897097.1 DUF192 domain-containing protein [Thermanaerothrix sp. 4228-RoL]